MKCVPDILYDPVPGLAFDLYLPDELKAQSCVIYMHDGDFKSGKRSDNNTLKLADRLTELGIALAAPSYRLNVGPEAFSADDVKEIAGYVSRAEKTGLSIPTDLCGIGHYAAVQDLSHLIEYLWVEGEALGIQSRHVGVVGLGAGGLAALTLAHPPRAFAERLSRPDAVISISSTFVQPWRLRETGATCLLFNAEDDPRVPIKDARLVMKSALKKTAPVTQIELGRTGSHQPFDIVLRGADGTATAYFERILRVLKP